MAIGNFVWYDQNGNSQYDSGESGIDNVSVKLYRDSNGNGVCEPGADTEVDSTTTGNGGIYRFLSVEPSTAGDPTTYYCLAVDKASVSSYSRSSTGGNHQPDVTGDQDQPNGDDGVPVGNYIISQPFPATINGQANTTDSGDPDGYPDASAYMTVDFGFTNGPTNVTLTEAQARTETRGWMLLFFLLMGGLGGLVGKAKLLRF